MRMFNNRKLYFSLRKTSLGVASVIIGISLYNVGQVQAATNTEPKPNNEDTTQIKPKKENKQNTSIQPKTSNDKITKTSAKAISSTDQTPVKGNLNITGQGVDKQNPNIINADTSNSQLTVHAAATNSSDKANKVEIVVEFPKIFDYTNNIHKVQAVLNHAVTVENMTNTNVTYSVQPGIYKPLATLEKDPDFNINNVLAIIISGQVASKQTGNVSAQLQIKNLNQIKKDLNSFLNNDTTEFSNPSLRNIYISSDTYYTNNNNTMVYGNSNNSIHYVEIPATNAMHAINETINKHLKLDAEILNTTDGKRIYSPAPKEIQAVMPTINHNDIEYYNIGSDKPSQILYSDGTYNIKLSTVFNAIKNLGYSTNINPNKTSIWKFYRYNSAGAGSWTKSPQGISPLYVQVQPIFSTKDLSLKTNNSWSPENNLTAAQVEFTNQFNEEVTGTENLKQNNNYTYQLTNQDGKVIYDSKSLKNDATVSLKPGQYIITYSYEINPTHIITKTAKITVASPASDIPTTPEIPTTPSVPTKPATPEVPGIPNKNNPADDINNSNPLPEVQPGKADNDNVKPVAPLATNQPEKVIDQNSRIDKKVIYKKDNQKMAYSKITTPKLSRKIALNAHKKVTHKKQVLPQTGNYSSWEIMMAGLVFVSVSLFSLVKVRNK